MRSVNKVILIGNLTRDPDLRQTPNGQAVCTFGIATNREWVTRDSQKHSLAEYHELVAWANLADICGKYLKKGKLIYIEGYLKTRSWDTPEGIRRHKTEIVIHDMIMLEKRPKGDDVDFVPNDEVVDYGDAPAEGSGAEGAKGAKGAEGKGSEEKPAEVPVEAPAKEPKEEEKKKSTNLLDDDAIEF